MLDLQSEWVINLILRLAAQAVRSLRRDLGDEAEDLVWEVIGKIIKRAPSIRPETLPNYFWRAIHNAKMDWLRKNRRWQVVPLDCARHHGVSPDWVRKVLLGELLVPLGADARHIMKLFAAGHTAEEIAVKLNSTPKRVSALVYRTLLQFRKAVRQRAASESGGLVPASGETAEKLRGLEPVHA